MKITAEIDSIVVTRATVDMIYGAAEKALTVDLDPVVAAMTEIFLVIAEAAVDTDSVIVQTALMVDTHPVCCITIT